jgi:hypothetical protein
MIYVNRSLLHPVAVFFDFSTKYINIAELAIMARKIMHTHVKNYIADGNENNKKNLPK